MGTQLNDRNSHKVDDNYYIKLQNSTPQIVLHVQSWHLAGMATLQNTKTAYQEAAMVGCLTFELATLRNTKKEQK